MLTLQCLPGDSDVSLERLQNPGIPQLWTQAWFLVPKVPAKRRESKPNDLEQRRYLEGLDKQLLMRRRLSQLSWLGLAKWFLLYMKIELSVPTTEIGCANGNRRNRAGFVALTPRSEVAP